MTIMTTPRPRRSLRQKSREATPVRGPLRLDRRTKDLTKRLQAGDIAVIHHADLDQVSAHALVACRPVAVVNAARSSSGVYPNLGPRILLEAGIPLLDEVGETLLTQVAEGAVGELRGADLLVEGDVVAHGTVLTDALVEQALDAARDNVDEQIEAFTRNTLSYLAHERDLLMDGVPLPDLRTSMRDRPALVVVRGYHYREDLLTLRPFIRRTRPVLIGVDGGADALREMGYRPDVIVGDMDSVSDGALTCGAEIVVHAYRDGRAPGMERVEALGVRDAVALPATGTSEDVAMLLADGLGADVIVAVGTHATLVEFLDKGRAGMASTFLARLRVGSKLIDAKGVSQLYRPVVSAWSLIVLIGAGALALFVALLTTAAGSAMLEVLGVWWDDLVSWIGGLFT